MSVTSLPTLHRVSEVHEQKHGGFCIRLYQIIVVNNICMFLFIKTCIFMFLYFSCFFFFYKTFVMF